MPRTGELGSHTPRPASARRAILRHAYYQDGQYVDEVRMAMLCEEWLSAARPRSWDLVAESLQADLD